ncbi:DUF2058 domain-containing protein [Thalassotalea euphylliae]|uniref:DUF2058 domain-containing protein n=1 Tax=Thalassotalea euphylliae TaxID=1655234 RepID=A0A3E0TN48_9GAMM|nr:DUF2058 domain-containing protein [Thalassotalea euphylliae]REL25976.1 DUF2058 domain-containing protein [Thalassotalea euphylliae]
MASLQDQLLKAGLTTKQKARQANSDKRKKNKQKRSGAQVEATMQEQVKQDIAKQKEQKLAKDAALNAEKQQQLAAKELHQRILQILTHHQVKGIEGEVEYNYTFGTTVKKLLVNALTQKALVNGRLSICGLDDITYVVTKETADKLATLDDAVVLLSNDKVEAAVDEDDPYAAYQIPDDLMW